MPGAARTSMSAAAVPRTQEGFPGCDRLALSLATFRSLMRLKFKPQKQNCHNQKLQGAVSGLGTAKIRCHTATLHRPVESCYGGAANVVCDGYGVMPRLAPLSLLNLRGRIRRDRATSLYILSDRIPT